MGELQFYTANQIELAEKLKMKLGAKSSKHKYSFRFSLSTTLRSLRSLGRSRLLERNKFNEMGRNSPTSLSQLARWIAPKYKTNGLIID